MMKNNKNRNNPMREISIEKTVINIGVGEAGEKLLKAEKVLQMLTNQKPIRTISKTTNKDLGIRKGMPIGCKVTMRGEKAMDFLKNAFWIKNNRIASYSFDQEGNFSLGIADYTDFPHMKYNPEIGIFGMDISVKLCRKGRRNTLRRRSVRKIPKKHRLTTPETIQYIKEKFNVEVVD